MSSLQRERERGQKCEAMDVLISLFMVSISQYIHISKHQVAHLKHKFLFVNYTPIKLKKSSETPFQFPQDKANPGFLTQFKISVVVLLLLFQDTHRTNLLNILTHMCEQGLTALCTL